MFHNIKKCRRSVVCLGTCGWLSELEYGAEDAPDRHVIYISSDEESTSLQSTRRRLGQSSEMGRVILVQSLCKGFLLKKK